MTDSAETDGLDDLPYPPIEPDVAELLDVGDGHRIWFESSGVSGGQPVLLLHDGPGAPPGPRHRRFFDPEFYRLHVIHQRGCGWSLPLVEVRANDTQALVSDIEKVRARVGADRWLISGGSWGSTLALAYAETHPERCQGLVLRGVALGRRCEIDWWWNGTRMLFPEAFDELLAALPLERRSNPMTAYHARLTDPDPEVHLPTSRALYRFSSMTVGNVPIKMMIDQMENASATLPLSRLFLHYCVNSHFLEPDQLLHDLHKITHLPCALISGRYDVTTPVDTAWTLHKRWPGSTWSLLPSGAHDLMDRPVATAFLDALEDMKALL